MYSNDLICNILIYINSNINSKIAIEDLEKRFFYNRYYIMKLFKKEIGMTIVEYINSIKIYNSISYMKDNNDSLLKISLQSGFYSLEYFSETFKHITNVNPSTFMDYLNNKKYIKEEDISNINDSIIKLFEINNIKDEYLSKRKRNTYPQRKLSIFK